MYAKGTIPSHVLILFKLEDLLKAVRTLQHLVLRVWLTWLAWHSVRYLSIG